MEDRDKEIEKKIDKPKTGRFKDFIGDKDLWAIILFLLSFSIPLMLSSGSDVVYNLEKGTFNMAVIKQIIYIIMGLVAMWVGSNLSITAIGRNYKAVAALISLLLVIAIFQNWGSPEVGRSISFFGVSFQVTELSKPVIILIAAYMLKDMGTTREQRFRRYITLCIVIALPMIMLSLTNISTFVIIVFGLFIIFISARVPAKALLITAGISIIIGVPSMYILHKTGSKVGRGGTAISRILNFNPLRSEEALTLSVKDMNLLLKQSSKLTADETNTLVGSYEKRFHPNSSEANPQFSQEEAESILLNEVNGLTEDEAANRVDRVFYKNIRDHKMTQEEYVEIGIHKSKFIGSFKKSVVVDYIEAGHTDFTFAIFMETFGWGPAFACMFLYIVLCSRCFLILNRCGSNFKALFIWGVLSMYMFQTMVNMGVSTHALPTTGQPLPFMSLGGSSVIFTCFAFGLINSIYNSSKDDIAEYENRLFLEKKDKKQ